MSCGTDRLRAAPENGDLPAEDVVGRDRLVGNVLASWGGHLVFVIAGFIMPRLIDRRLGQEVLGIWDFAWSLVAYFSFIQGGVASAVNRYVAKHRASNDAEGVNRAVSSAACLLGIAGAIVVGLAITAAWLLPVLFGDRLVVHTRNTQWVVLFLGLGIAVETTSSVFSGVITGCHRWGVHNAIKGGCHAASVSAMIGALFLGGGLMALAAAILAGLVVAALARWRMAVRVCPGLQVRPGLARGRVARDMLGFGGKTLVPSIANLLLLQTTSVLILMYLGPLELAMFARPLSLIRQLNTVVAKFAFVLTPTSSAMDAINTRAELKSLLVRSVRYAAYLVIPVILLFVLHGDGILGLWMGRRYENGTILAILALGYLPTLVQAPALGILSGLNAHGRPGLANLVAALVCIGLSIVALSSMKLGLTGVALGIALPLAVANGVYLPIYCCRRLGLRLSQFVPETMIGPLLCAAPFGLCLLAARVGVRSNPTTAFVLGAVVGGPILLLVYWRYVVPVSIRRRVIHRFGRPARSAVRRLDV